MKTTKIYFVKEVAALLSASVSFSKVVYLISASRLDNTKKVEDFREEAVLSIKSALLELEKFANLIKLRERLVEQTINSYHGLLTREGEEDFTASYEGEAIEALFISERLNSLTLKISRARKGARLNTQIWRDPEGANGDRLATIVGNLIILAKLYLKEDISYKTLFN